ncbi:MAG TPA: outer membrane beta-barrel protein [Bacteroidia bacterium]|nr:outer membrane beta-barrel protein [Bacteroidia bacterium]
MKQRFRNSFLVGLVLSSVLVYGQAATEPLPQSMPSLKKVSSMQDNLILGIGLTNWLSVPAQVETETFMSREFSVIMMGERMTSSGIIGLGFGIGFNSQNVAHDASLTKSSDGQKTVMTKIPKEIDYSINKLSLNFIDAQLELRLHSKPNKKQKRFKLSAGMKAGLLLQSHTKYKDDSGTYKVAGVSNINKYQYGITSRLGYANWAIGGYYSLVGIFKDDKGPELVPYSVCLYLTL